MMASLVLVSTIALALASANGIPNNQGCLLPSAKALPYCNPKLDVDSRVKDLVGRMSLAEKISNISPQPKLGSPCGDHTAGKPDIGLPPYYWLVETNSNVAANCLTTTPYKCPTTFIGPLGISSSFNRTLWGAHGSVLGTELRAFNNLNGHRSDKSSLIGVTGYGPNINIARDPRFGRNSELAGEDPVLSGTYATEMVKGMQEKDEAGHLKMVALLKHFTAYSQETNRMHSEANMTMFDLHDTYLPQYEIAFTQSNASGVMCSYAAINNRPSCANDYILKTILRQKWNQPNAVVTTDCGAVRNVEGAPSNAATPVIAAAWTINNGTDLEMGTTVWTDYMAAAVSAGLVTEDTITTAVSRLFRVHFLAGRFDPLDQVKWAALGAESINSTWNQQVQSEAGHQGVVLLKNDADALPLKSGTTIAVVGPMAVNQDMRSDYAGSRGEAGCYPKGDTSCVITIGQSIANMNTGGTTTIVKGVDINSNNSTGIAAAVAAAKAADIVVVAVGIDRSIEHEGVDRTSTTLPGQQESLITAVQATGKPIVLVMSNGGALAIDNFLSGSNAIVEAFNIAFSAPSLADLLFGKVNRWGKLPITMYPQTFVNQKDMNDYDMSSGVGRTYRYYKGTPLYEFGHGLSLTEFSLSCTADGGGSLAFTCNVSNTGNMDGDEVIQVYHAAGEAIRGAAQHPVPIKSLVDFSRVTVTKGGVATVHFQIEQSALLLTNADGDKVLYKGLRDFIFSTGAGPEVTIPYTV